MSRTDNFQKFVKQPKAGAVKEKIRQEKKKEKKERAASIEEHFARKRAERAMKQGIDPKAAVVTKPGKKGENKYKTGKVETPVGVTAAPTYKTDNKPVTEQMPLNKYIAHSGLCSRRDAIVLIKDQKVTIDSLGKRGYDSSGNKRAQVQGVKTSIDDLTSFLVSRRKRGTYMLTL